MKDQIKRYQIWKNIAIIFIILFILESLFIVGVVVVYNKEQAKQMECFYVVCEDYPEAYYEYDLCTCYDYDVMGELVPTKHEILK